MKIQREHCKAVALVGRCQELILANEITTAWAYYKRSEFIQRQLSQVNVTREEIVPALTNKVLFET